MQGKNLKRLLGPLLFLSLLLGLTACTEPEPDKDAVLVVEQNVNKEKGLRYVTNTMTWEQASWFPCVLRRRMIHRTMPPQPI